MKVYSSYILILFSLFINFINAKNEDIITNDNKNITCSDKYYLIFVNNEHGEYKVFYNSKTQKRDESQLFIESLIDDINTLIINNKDTYENPEKLNEIEETYQINKRKRSENSQEIYSYNESSFVRALSSVDNHVVLYAYLSEILAKKLPTKFENIIHCIPDGPFFELAHRNYNVDEILAETKWKKVSVRENAKFHLSLISQGKFNGAKEEYDDNYYYPSSAGKDVDLVFIDTSFNFGYAEFSNTNERTIKCLGIVKNGEFYPGNKCSISKKYHGEKAIDVAAGLSYGVASRANVYGVALTLEPEGYPSFSNSLKGMQYVYDNMIRPHKTIINLSFGSTGDLDHPVFIQLKLMIEKIIQKGGIVVSSSGNNGMNFENNRKNKNKGNTYFLPCELDDVICVGGINNSGKDFKNVYKLDSYSNYGKNVDLYAPCYVSVKYMNNNNEVVRENAVGTSFSSPIVAGIIANIISDDKNTKYTKSTILSKLKKYGKNLTFKLPDNSIGILANNGKHTLYSSKSGNNSCYGQESGYRCCSHCNVASTDENGKWGVENNDWCGIKYSCDNVKKNTCYGQESGYSCCSHCNVVSEDDSGKWGVENNNWCGIKYSCGNGNICYGQESGYSCCSHCNVASEEDNSKWGVENNSWCGIKYSCGNGYSCYGQEQGYPCCSHCKIESQDENGKWGVENNAWCGIKFSC